MALFSPFEKILLQTPANLREDYRKRRQIPVGHFEIEDCKDTDDVVVSWHRDGISGRTQIWLRTNSVLCGFLKTLK